MVSSSTSGSADHLDPRRATATPLLVARPGFASRAWGSVTGLAKGVGSTASKVSSVASTVLSKVTSTTLRVAGYTLGSRPVVYVSSALLGYTSSRVQIVSGALRATANYIKRAHMLEEGFEGIVNLSQERLRQIQHSREVAGDALQGSLAAVKVGKKVAQQAANWIPGARTALDTALDAVEVLAEVGQTTERELRRAELVNLHGASHLITFLGNFLSPVVRHTVPTVIGLFEGVFGGVESASRATADWAEYQMEHLELAGSTLMNLADAIDSRRWILANSFTSSSTAQNLEAFLALSSEDQELLLTLSEKQLKGEERKQLDAILERVKKNKTVSNNDKKALEALIKAFKELPENEKNRVTKEDYDRLSPGEKVRYLKVVQQYAKKLTVEERKLLEKHKDKLVTSRLQECDAATKLGFQKIISAHFHTLSADERLMKDVPAVDQLLALKESVKEDKALLNDFFQAVDKHVKTKKVEKDRLELLKKKLSEAKGAQKEIAKQALYEYATSLYADYLRSSTELVLQARALQRLLDKDVAQLVLKAREGEGVAHLEKPHIEQSVDRSHVHDLVGAHVTENSAARALQKAPGRFLSLFPEYTGKLGEKTVRLLSSLIGSKPFATGLEWSAKAIEFAAAFPHTIEFVKAQLLAVGLPIKEIDEMVRYLPMKFIEFGLSITRPGVDFIAAQTQFLQEKALWLLSVKDDEVRAASLPQVTAQMKKAVSSCNQAHKALARTVEGFCNPKSVDHFTCSPEVRLFMTNPTALKELADKSKMSIPALWEHMSQRGAIPDAVLKLAKPIISAHNMTMAPNYALGFAQQCHANSESLKKAFTAPQFQKILRSLPKEEAGYLDALGKKTEELFSWFSSAVSGAAKDMAKAAVDRLQQSEIGQGVIDVATGAQIMTAPVVNAAVSAGTKVAQNVAGLAQQGATAAVDMAERLAGRKQSIPSELLPGFETLQKMTAALQNDQKNHLLATEAMTRLAELEKEWYSRIVKLAAHYGESVLTLFSEGIAPAILGSCQQAQALGFFAEASKKLLKAQIEIERHTQSYEEYQGSTGAIAALAKQAGDKASVAKTALGYGYDALSFLQTVGDVGFVVPSLVRKVIPASLRQLAGYAPKMQNGLNFLAEEAVALGQWGKVKLERFGTQTIGAGIYTKLFMPSGHVDPLRIRNFQTLTKEEQQYLFDTAMKKLPEESVARKEIQSARQLLTEGNQVKLIENKALLQRAIETTLREYDKLYWSEIGELTAGEFARFDGLSQRRVAHVVERHCPLSNEEKRQITQFLHHPAADSAVPELLVRKFNALSTELRQQIYEVTYSDYMSLPPEKQQDLLFMMAHSKECEPLIDRITGTKPGDPLRAIKAYRAMGSLSKAVLEKELLPMVHRVSDEVRASLLTPLQLKSLGDGKVRQLYEEVVRYFGATAMATMAKESPFDDVRALERYFVTPPKTAVEEKHKRRLIENLITIYNQLPPAQQLQLYSMKESEYPHFKVVEKQELIKFLMGHEALESSLPLLREELAAMERGESIHSKKILQLFNGLDGYERRGFYQSTALQQLFQTEYQNACQIELNKVNIKLYAVEEPLTKLRRVTIPALQWQTDRTAQQKRLDEINKLLQAQNMPPEKRRELETEKRFVEKNLTTLEKSRAKNEKELQKSVKEVEVLIKRKHQLKAEQLGLERLLGVASVPFDPYELAENVPISPEAVASLNEAVATNRDNYQKEVVSWAALTPEQFAEKAKLQEAHISGLVAAADSRYKKAAARATALAEEMSRKPPAGLEGVQRLMEFEYIQRIQKPNSDYLVKKYKEMQLQLQESRKEAARVNAQPQNRVIEVTPVQQREQRMQ